jgi:hypothetical protein
LRATRQAQCQRIGREQRAFPGRRQQPHKESKDSPQSRRVRRVSKAPRPQANLDDSQQPADVGARLRATRQAQCQRIGREQRAFPGRRQQPHKESEDSPQSRRVRRVSKAPRPQANLDDSQQPADVGARLRATRQAQCQRIGREQRAFPGRRVLPSKNVSIHRRAAEYAEFPRRLARKRTLTTRSSQPT